MVANPLSKYCCRVASGKLVVITQLQPSGILLYHLNLVDSVIKGITEAAESVVIQLLCILALQDFLLRFPKNGLISLLYGNPYLKMGTPSLT